MIKTLLLIGVFLIPAAAVPVRAEATASEKVQSIRSWFSRWATGLKRSAVQGRYRKVRTTSVAAVRGSKQDSNPNLPYWKGTWSAKKFEERMAEQAELEGAVKLVLDGDFPGAEKALAKFEADHPKSTLLSDVKGARAQLAVLKESAAPPAVAVSTPSVPVPAVAEPAPKPAPEAVKPEKPSPAASEEKPANAPPDAKPAEKE